MHLDIRKYLKRWHLCWWRKQRNAISTGSAHATVCEQFYIVELRAQANTKKKLKTKKNQHKTNSVRMVKLNVKRISI